MSYLLAIDQGTSSTRAMVYGVDGQLKCSSQCLVTQSYPKSGWVEHDPEQLWSNTLQVVSQVLLEIPATQILACGITNQRETTIVWDKRTGRCLAPAIVWQDRRTAEYCDSLSEYSAMIQKKTGLLPDSYFSASKLHWLLTHHPHIKALADQGHLCFGTVDSFLIWRLTGGAHVTDVTNASRTLLFNINTLTWDDDLLNLFAIPKAIMPEVLSCDAHFGVIDKSHFGVEIPITGVAGDQHAALIGQGCFADGMIKATFGTGAFLLLNTGEHPVFSKHRLLTTIAYRIKEKTVYGLEGSIYHAGTSVKWLRDEMKMIIDAAETELLAQSLERNEGVYFVSSFTGLGAPHWLSHPGALLVGLSRNSTKAHIARAILEGVCYQAREVLSCMIDDSNLPLSLLRVDGGMAVNQWFLQFLAEQCQLKVQKPHDIETTARGAAILAAIGAGILDVSSSTDTEREFVPEQSKAFVESCFAGWCDALKKAMT